MNVFDLIRRPVAAVSFILLASALSAFGGTNLVVWDTMKATAKWQVVPSNLMELEKDPLKSASDPGYYGRDYVFSGDVAVAVRSAAFIAYISRDSGRVYIKHGKLETAGETLDDTAKFPEQLERFFPFKPMLFGEIFVGTTKRVTDFELIRNTADEVVLRAEFGNGDAVTYSFGDNEIIEVKPAGSIKKVGFKGATEFVVAPGFVGDDLIFKPEDGERVSIPAENMLVNLLSGEGRMAVMTWPGKANVIATKQGDYLSSMEVETATGEPVFIAALSAPGIWHREKLGAEFLEKDKTLEWKAPFMAKWQTQLIEGNVKTTYAFRHAKGTVWRGVAGSYNYPVWFEGDKANFSLSKKVPAKGEAIIYFLEGDDTPSSVLTPVDVLKMTLGRPAADKILDVEGRKLRTHHGASGSNVHRACTCGYTEAIQAVFEKGEECDKKEFVDQSIQDMIYFVKAHLARIDEYRGFATNLTEYLHTAAKSNPALKEYLEDLEATVQQIPAEYENQKENMKSLEYAAELEKKTMALTGKKDPENLKRYMDLLKLWRGMGGAQDGVVAQYHILARKIFQDAGYNVASVGDAKALDVAQEIRARCKQILRNPDGYEIWADY